MATAARESGLLQSALTILLSLSVLALSELNVAMLPFYGLR